MKRARQRRDDGFTMIEVMVALVLLTIVLAGTMALQLTTIRATQSSQNTTTAMVLAQSEIEKFRARADGSLTSADALTQTDHFDVEGNPSTTTPGFFQRTTDVTDNSTTTGSETFTITVTVSWRAVGGSQQISMAMERNP